MSSIGHGIAASVSQTMVQQNQVAKSRDAEKNRQQRSSERLRERAEKHLSAVEHAAQVTGDPMRVDDEHKDSETPRRRRQAHQSYAQHAAQAEAEPAPGDEFVQTAPQALDEPTPPERPHAPGDNPDGPMRHVDIRA